MRREGKGGRVIKKGGCMGISGGVARDAGQTPVKNLWQIMVNVDEDGSPSEILLSKAEDAASQIMLYKAGERAFADLQERAIKTKSPVIDEKAPFRLVRRVSMDKAPDLSEVMWDIIAIYSQAKFQSVHEVMISMDGGTA